MHALTNHDDARPGTVSVRLLLLAMVATAVLSAAVVWTLTRSRVAAPDAKASAEASKAGEHANDLPPGVVELPETAQKNARLEVLTAAARTLPLTIEVTGTVTADEARVAHVKPLARGLIERVWVRLGERVRKGQPLVTYDNIALGELIGEYLSARAVLRQAEADLDVKRKALDRGRELIKLEAIARQTLDLREAEFRSAEAAVARDRAAVTRVEEQIHRFGLSDPDLEKLSPEEGKTAHREASHSVMRAPIDGIVTKYDVASGEVVEPERELFTISDLSSVWVLADVYEKDLAKVPTGTQAVVRVDTYPDRAFQGRVAYVSDLIESQTRTAKVRCVVDNPDGALKLDMFARVTVPTRDQRQGVAVPANAVQQVDNQPVLFVRQTATRFERRNVQLGATTGDLVEIRDGLRPGESVVGAGSFYLKTALLRERIGDEH
jgi:cobalt-zinc-cadmium efflux system membrane fusion protein